jgi:hypothetical protein
MVKYDRLLVQQIHQNQLNAQKRPRWKVSPAEFETLFSIWKSSFLFL